MENKTETTLLNSFEPEKLSEILQAADSSLQESRTALLARAAGMEDKDVYTKLVDYCCDFTKTYLAEAAHMEQVLNDPSNIEKAYADMTGSEEFQSICTKEYNHLPRVVAMVILAGSECAAADAAMELTREEDPQKAMRLDNLAELYHKYMSDALVYGRGDDKNISVGGPKA